MRFRRAIVNGVAGGKVFKDDVSGRALSPHAFAQFLRHVHHVRLEVNAGETVRIDWLARMMNLAKILVGKQDIAPVICSNVSQLNREAGQVVEP